MSVNCRTIRLELGAYVDGELRGGEMLRVSQHLAACPDCAREAAAIDHIGGCIREAASVSAPSEIDGLASGVVSRMRAEAEQSWAGVVERAVSDWHWAIVGAGSVVATVVSTFALSVLLALGPGPERADSLAALMSNLASPAGFLFFHGSMADDRDASLFQIDNGEPMASGVVTALAARPLDRRPSEAELAGKLADVVVRNGRVVSLESLNAHDRADAEELLSEIRGRRQLRSLSVLPAVTVKQVRLVTSTVVTAKGL